MPIYVYRCPVCHETGEFMLPLSDAEKPVFCHNGHDKKVKMVRQVSSCSFRLIGGGWASDNYAKKRKGVYENND